MAVSTRAMGFKEILLKRPPGLAEVKLIINSTSKWMKKWVAPQDKGPLGPLPRPSEADL